MMMTKRAKIEPRGEFKCRPSPARMMFTPLRRSSRDMSMMTRFLRTRTPARPIVKTIKPNPRTASIGITDGLPSGDDDGPDEDGQQEDRGGLEREEIRGEEHIGHLLEYRPVFAGRGGGEAGPQDGRDDLGAQEHGHADKEDLRDESPLFGDDLF